MNTITAQRRRLDQMLAKVRVLKDNSASNGRSLAPRFKDPISRVLKKVSISYHETPKKSFILY